jgi:hypothetical protein
MRKLSLFFAKNWKIADKSQAICSGLDAEFIPISILKEKKFTPVGYPVRKVINNNPENINKYIVLYENENDLIVFIYLGRTYILKNLSDVCFLNAFMEQTPILRRRVHPSLGKYIIDNELLVIFSRIADKLGTKLPDADNVKEILEFESFMSGNVKGKLMTKSSDYFQAYLQDSILFDKFTTRLLIMSLRLQLFFKKKNNEVFQKALD